VVIILLTEAKTTRGNYSTYRGKDNEGKTKKAFAEELAPYILEDMV
jgi:hypothetical protein